MCVVLALIEQFDGSRKERSVMFPLHGHDVKKSVAEKVPQCCKNSCNKGESL